MEEKKKTFKKNSIYFVIFQCILITLSVIVYILRDMDVGISNFSMVSLFSVVLIFTVFIGIFVGGYIINGLYRYDIAGTGFIKNINYKLLLIIILILMIAGAGAFFTQLVLVSGQMADLTWGSLILEIAGLIIFTIALIISIVLIINEFSSK